MQPAQKTNRTQQSGIELGEKSHLLGPTSSATAAPVTFVSNDAAANSEVEEDCCSRYLKKGYLRCYSLVGLLLFVAIFLLVYPLNLKGGSHHKLMIFHDGERILLSSAQHALYLRTSSSSADGDGADAQGDIASNLVMTESIPWQHGSTFEVQHVKDGCFKLKTMKGNWMRVDYSTGEIAADVASQKDATYFSALSHDLPASRIAAKDIPSKFITLKVCWKDEFISIKPLDEPHEPVGKQTSSSGYKLALTKQSFENSRYYSSGHVLRADVDITDLPTTAEGAAPLRLEIVQHIEGVNLGGWFIPEVWMNPSFYNGTGLGWSGSLCRITNFSRSLAEERIKHQLETWMEESDFAEIRKYGYNSVRLPIGYWNIIEDPYQLFAPQDVSLSLQVIDWTFDMALKYNLTVLLDLHGVPGSQNGIDHSGCSMPSTWLENDANIDLTLQTIKKMAHRYGKHPALLGFELANEPSLFYSQEMHDTMVDFYKKSYKLIRSYNAECTIVFNELYEACYSMWAQELQEPEYYNVVMDVHLYDWQEPYTKEDADEHIADAVGFAKTIDGVAIQHPIIVGEWCFSTGTHVQAGQPFVDACVNSFRHAFGWYIWNWKIEPGAKFDEWDVQYQHSLSGGMRAVTDLKKLPHDTDDSVESTVVW